METSQDRLSAQPAVAQFRKFPIAQIKSSRSQARMNFGEAGIQSLAQSMNINGLDNPIQIRLLPDGSAELVSGERRLRAAKLLAWTEIEAKIFPVLSDQKAAIKGLIENLQREDLSPIETARGYKNLSGPPFQRNQKQIAEMTGEDRTLVNKYLAVSKLCGHPGGVNQFTPLTLKHLLELVRLPQSDDQASLADETAKKDLSVDQLRALVDQKVGPSPKKEGKKGKNGDQKASAPFKFTRKDVQVTMTGILDNPDNQGGFFMDFQRAYLLWANKGAAKKAGTAAGPVIERTAVPPPLEGGRDDTPVNGPSRQPPLPPSKPRVALSPKRVSVPVPQLEDACYVKGDRLQLKWRDLGEGFSYRILFTKNLENSSFQPLEEGKTVTTPGAIVNVYSGGDKEAHVAVQAIDAEGHFSDLSETVKFELKAWNDEFSVKPLPMAVRTPAPAAPSAATAPVLTPSSSPAPVPPSSPAATGRGPIDPGLQAEEPAPPDSPVMSPEKQKAVQAALAMKAKLMRRYQ